MPPRRLFFCTAVACCALLAYGYYLQYHDGLEPCPMCIFQRLCYMMVAAVCVVGTLHGPLSTAKYVYSGLVVFAAGTGAAIAGRQVWLQHLPPDLVPECGPGLAFMLEVYPLADAIKTALAGTGECASVDWTFLGASIAEWSLLCFVAIVLLHLTFIGITIRHNSSIKGR